MKDWFWIPCAILGGLSAIGDAFTNPGIVQRVGTGLIGFYGSIVLGIVLRWLEARE